MCAFVRACDSALYMSLFQTQFLFKSLILISFSTGEEDPGLRRGKPLRLDAARYRELEHFVVCQLLDEQILQPESNHASRQAVM